jgi:hypothetical protein
LSVTYVLGDDPETFALTGLDNNDCYFIVLGIKTDDTDQSLEEFWGENVPISYENPGFVVDETYSNLVTVNSPVNLIIDS